MLTLLLIIVCEGLINTSIFFILYTIAHLIETQDEHKQYMKNLLSIFQDTFSYLLCICT